MGGWVHINTKTVDTKMSYTQTKKIFQIHTQTAHKESQNRPHKKVTFLGSMENKKCCYPPCPHPLLLQLFQYIII